MGCRPRSLLDSGRLFLAGHRIAEATGELVPVFALSLGELSGARSEKGRSRLLIERRKRSDSNKRCGGSNSDGQRWQRGGQHVAGTLVTVRADPPPPGKEFAGWSGDIQILANPSEETTTATITSIDVTISATYADVRLEVQP